MADGDYISGRADIEKVFGIENILRWADADNDKNVTTIDTRIDWANELAEQEVLGRLSNGPYDISSIRTVKPKMIILVCASLAGVQLYDTRRVVDAANKDAVSQQRRNVITWINQIFSGQLKLLHPTTYEPLDKVCENSPRVVTE